MFKRKKSRTPVIRIQLQELGIGSTSLTLETDNLTQVSEFIKNMFQSQLVRTEVVHKATEKPKMPITRVTIFKAIGTKREGSQSFSLYGVSLQRATELIKTWIR